MGEALKKVQSRLVGVICLWSYGAGIHNGFKRTLQMRYYKYQLEGA